MKEGKSTQKEPHYFVPFTIYLNKLSNLYHM